MNNNQTERKDGPHVSTSYPKRSGANCRHLRPHPHRRGGRTGHRGLGPGGLSHPADRPGRHPGGGYVRGRGKRPPGGHRQDQPGAGPRVRRGRLDPGRPPGTGHGTPHPGGGPPGQGRGYGSRFVDFYESYALEHGCRYLRMDTNERNASARALYRNLGYREVSIVPCAFNGIPGVQLVCLEKTL